MFGQPFPLFRAFGVRVKADPSWLVIVALIVWTLAAREFPVRYPELAASTHWIMALFGAAGLFGSIVLHELAHALVARRFRLPVRGITLFLFGGVAELGDEPPTPKAEFWVAVAGPLLSVALAGVELGAWAVGVQAGWPTAVVGLFGYLGAINGLLAAFNVIPAFPLDGGRVLRSILWAAKGNLRWATRVTSGIGAAFGLVLMGLGFVALLQGNLIGGVWLVLIGLFLRGASAASYRQLLLRRALEGEPVRRFMTVDPITVPAEADLREFVEDYVYRHHYKMFPVTHEGRLVGCLTADRVKDVAREAWETTTVGSIAEECSGGNVVGPETDALRALARMQKLGRSRLMVVDDAGGLLGIFGVKDVMKLMALRVELDDADDTATFAPPQRSAHANR